MTDATVCTSNSISVSWAECNKRNAFFDRLLLAAIVRHSANQRHLIVESKPQIKKKRKKLLTICDVASLKQNLNSFQPNLPSTRPERLFIMVIHAATASSEAFFVDKSRCEHFKSYQNRIISAASLMNILQNCKILAHPTTYKTNVILM
uniref:Uncharacterized protein n=1 Tax=Glossina pallidipes TaxID=7398 RepID=A0A1A9ZEG2_GLOPL